MSHSDYKGIVVIIPTRNRTALCMNAIHSVLDQKRDNVHVLVSDNSTAPEESQSMARYCTGFNDGRLRYIKTPESMSVDKHFDWMFRQALGLYDANHFTCLTDRMQAKTGSARLMHNLASRHPDEVICFLWDTIYDDMIPITVKQHAWTGKLIRMPASRLLYLASEMREHYTPKLTNCITPRGILEAVRGRFGDLCVSLTPDICFGYRCLALVDAVLHYDKALFLQYGMGRSNANNYAKGQTSADLADYLANVGDTRLNYASPVPEILTTVNGGVHEYCLVKQQVADGKFPDLNMDMYWGALSDQISLIVNPERRQKMHALLMEHHRSGSVARAGDTPAPARNTSLVSRVINKILWESKSAAMKSIWLFLYRHFRVCPPEDHRFTFNTVAEAIRFANDYPPRRRHSFKAYPRREITGARVLE